MIWPDGRRSSAKVTEAQETAQSHLAPTTAMSSSPGSAELACPAIASGIKIGRSTDLGRLSVSGSRLLVESRAGPQRDKRISMNGNMRLLNGCRKRHERTAPLVIFKALVLTLASSGCVLHLAGQTQAPKGDGTAAPSTVSAQAAISKKPDPVSVARGKALFVSNCGFCHGANAKGGETGPDLIRSITVLDDDRGDLIGAAVSNGRPERGMPKFAFSDDQMSDLVTYLHNQVHAAAAFSSYQVLNIVVGDAKAGEAYFNGAGGCSSCHSVTGDFAHIGSKYAPVELQQRFIMPRGDVSLRGPAQPEGSTIEARVILPSGESYEGHLTAIDDFSLTLIDAKGERRTFPRDGDTPRVELRDPLQKHIDLIGKYADSDIHNLTAYLVTLK